MPCAFQQKCCGTCGTCGTASSRTKRLRGREPESKSLVLRHLRHRRHRDRDRSAGRQPARNHPRRCGTCGTLRHCGPSKIAVGSNTAMVPVKSLWPRCGRRRILRLAEARPLFTLQAGNPQLERALRAPLVSSEVQSNGRSIERELACPPSLFAGGALLALIGSCRQVCHRPVHDLKCVSSPFHHGTTTGNSPPMAGAVMMTPVDGDENLLLLPRANRGGIPSKVV